MAVGVAGALGAGAVAAAVLETLAEQRTVMLGAGAATGFLGLVGAVAAVLTARQFRGGFLERPMYFVAAGAAFVVLRRGWLVATAELPAVPAPPHVVEQVVLLAAVVVWAIGFVELEQSI